MSENIITLDADNATVKSVVAQVKSDMRGAGKYGAYVAEFGVTHDTVKDHALAIARLVTPETAQKKDGKRTRFGNAVQAAGYGLRTALGKKEGEEKPITLRVSLSGEGGGTTVVDPTHPLYGALVEMIHGGAQNDAA